VDLRRADQLGLCVKVLFHGNSMSSAVFGRAKSLGMWKGRLEAGMQGMLMSRPWFLKCGKQMFR